ncbi:hypothetical protein, partial [Pseudomonas cannabina]|uniref:hypothetical protein n=1 Tax=Pseudomonas cannabina TaxID=86840 RepID=UPI001EE3EC40
GEGHLFHLGSTLHFSGLAYFSRFGSLFQSFPNGNKAALFIHTLRRLIDAGFTPHQLIKQILQRISHATVSTT